MNDEDRMAHPNPMTLDEQTQAMLKVMELAQRLGLHGILILSPMCKVCPGTALHHWHVISDLGAGSEGGDKEVADLLGYWANYTRNRASTDVGEARPQ